MNKFVRLENCSRLELKQPEMRSCVILLGLSLVLASLLVAAQDAGGQLSPPTEQLPADTNENPVQEEENKEDKRRHFKLMFNFDQFKQSFRKVYQSSIEEMVRLRLFLARSYRAFISAVSYKHRGSSYYLSVNERSDWTKAELERSENNFLTNDDDHDDHDHQRSSERNENNDDEEEEYLEPEQLEAELAEIERHSGEPRYAQLADELRRARGKSRRRRSTDDGPRDFDIAQAFDRSASRSGAKLKRRVVPASNNPEYRQPEQMSMGSYLDHVNKPDFKTPVPKWINRGNWRDYSQLPVKGQYKTVRYLDSFWSLLGLGDSSKQTRNVAPEGRRTGDQKSLAPTLRDGTDDVVWVDQRRSKCLPEVQNQRACGSCYAFAVTAFFEHAYCRETGQLVKFSEQYLVDCGHKLEMDGCDGAPIEISGEFFANFGVELSQHYPYRERQEMCPYSPATEMAHMGYLRLDVNYLSRIPVPVWEDYLEHTVIAISINTAGDFQEYGGGVWDGRKCETRPRHAMLVIGHGREDGEEYWLIRNSYGPTWGEEGHFRLNKNSDCIHPHYGYVWGSHNGGANVRLWPERNKHVPEPVAKDARYQVKRVINSAGNTINFFKGLLPGGREQAAAA